MNSNLYLNLIEGDIVATRSEITSKYDLLRRDAISTSANIKATPSKFSLAGTHIDSVLGQIVTLEITSK